jgi:hypothetical protein
MGVETEWVIDLQFLACAYVIIYSVKIDIWQKAQRLYKKKAELDREEISKEVDLEIINK